MPTAPVASPRRPLATVLASAVAAALAGSLLALAPPSAAAPGAIAPAAAPTAAVPDRSRAYSTARATQVVERRVIGRSVRGRPIVALRKGNPAARHTVLVLGQMHGNEPAGPRTVAAIRDRLRVDSDVDLWLVPTMNPDGALRGTRKNARGVDLNRNWPTTGWQQANRNRAAKDFRGRRPASERETRVMMRFLRQTQPDLIASLHQPLYAVGRNGKTPAFVARLARELGLPARELSVGTSTGRVSPTLTGWYNARFRGGAVTVEYGASPSATYVTDTAAHGLLRATLADW